MAMTLEQQKAIALASARARMSDADSQPVQQPQAGQESDYYNNPMNAIGSATEPLMHLASSSIATPIAGLAGLGTMAGNAMGMTNADPTQVINDVSNSMTYQPKTSGGQVATDAITTPFQLLGKGAQWVGDRVGYTANALAQGLHIPQEYAQKIGANAAAAGSIGVNALPAILGGGANFSSSTLKGITERNQRLSTLKIDHAQELDSVQRARDAGYKFTPALVPGSPYWTRVLNGISGGAKQEQSVSIPNQILTQNLSKDEVGINRNQPLTPQALDTLHAKYNIPYEEAASIPETVIGTEKTRSQLGNYTTKDIVTTGRKILDDLNYARTQAKLNYRENKMQGTAESYNKAKAFNEQAIELENKLDKLAVDSGNPELVQRLRDARTKKAKLYTIDDAMNDATGKINALDIGKKARNGGKVTGPAGEIANFANGFGEIAREPSSFAEIPISPLDWATGIFSGGALPLGRLAARKYLTSEMGQRAMTKHLDPNYSTSVMDGVNSLYPSSYLQDSNNK